MSVLPSRTFTSLEEVSEEYTIFHLVDFDFAHEDEILQIYNNEIQYDETATYPEYLLPHFSAFAFRYKGKQSAMQILRKLSQINHDIASNLIIDVHFESENVTQAKKCIKQQMKRNCGKSYCYQYKQKMQYLGQNPNLKLSKRNKILEDALKCLNISFNLGFTPAINQKYNYYLNHCQINNIPFSNVDYGETSKYFMGLGCDLATLYYAMHLFDISRYAESKLYFITVMKLNECCLSIHSIIRVHRKYVFLKKNGIVADFFSEQEMMEWIEYAILCHEKLFIGMEPVDCPVIGLVEFCAKNGELEKCADILELVGNRRDDVKEILPTLFSVIKTYSLSVPKNLIGWYQYEEFCNNVVTEYECQFCMESVTSFIPFGCKNGGHGCCKECFNKCSVCPYKCV